MSEKLIILPCNPPQDGRVLNPKTHNCVLMDNATLRKAAKEGVFIVSDKLPEKVQKYYDPNSNVRKEVDRVKRQTARDRSKVKMAEHITLIPTKTVKVINICERNGRVSAGVLNPLTGKCVSTKNPTIQKLRKEGYEFSAAVMAPEFVDRKRDQQSSLPVVLATDFLEPCGPDRVISPRTKNCVLITNQHVKEAIKARQMTLAAGLTPKVATVQYL